MIEGIFKLSGVDFAILLDDPGWVVDAALAGIGDKRTRQIISVFVARFIKAALAKRAKLMEYFLETTRQLHLDSALPLGEQEGVGI